MRYGQGWAELHPDWRIVLWSENASLPYMHNQAIFDMASIIAPNNVGQLQADVLRYELLWRYGGVWIDTDFECLKPIDELLDGVECFAAWERQGVWMNNAIMGATPEHPFIGRLRDNLKASIEANPGARPNVMTGPQYLTKQYRADPTGVMVFDQHLFYPYAYNELHRADEEFPNAMAIHRWNNQRRKANR